MKVLRMGKEILPAVFSVIFEATSKFLIVFVRLILRKVWLDRKLTLDINLV